MATQINTSNALGAKVLAYAPLNGTEQTIPFELWADGGVKYSNDATYGPYAYANTVPDANGVGVIGGPAFNMDLSAQNAVTFWFRLYVQDTNNQTTFESFAAGQGATSYDQSYGGMRCTINSQFITLAMNNNAGGVVYAGKNTPGLNNGWHTFAVTFQNGTGNDCFTLNVDGADVALDFGGNTGNGGNVVTGNRGTNQIDLLSTGSTLISANRMQRFTIFQGALTTAEKSSMNSNPDQILVPVTNPNAPTLVSAVTLDATTIKLTFNKTLHYGIPPSTCMVVNGHPYFGVDVDTNGPSAYIYNISPSMANGETLTVSYTPPTTDPLQDLQGNLVAAFSNVAVSNTLASAPPVVTGITTPNNQTIAIAFNRALDGTIPATSAFSLSGTTRTFNVQQTAGSNICNLINILPVIQPGETINVSYTQPASNALQDANALKVATFTNQAVTNSVSNTVSAPAAPTNVTATALNGGALVYATKPTNNGNRVITKYTVTSFPGGITASGPDFPLYVPGLSNGTAYTFTVKATNSQGDSVASQPSASVTPTATSYPAPVVKSEDTNVAIRNPERGWVHQLYFNTGISQATLNSYAAGGDSLIWHYVYLPSSAVTSPLDSTFFTTLQNEWNMIRNAGLKMVLRFAFTDTAPTDAPLSQVLALIAQLKPVMAQNADIIAMTQCGWVGQWGEFGGSNNFGSDPYYTNLSTQNLADRKAVIDAMVDATPDGKCTMIRNPWYKPRLYRATPISDAEAHNTSLPIARIGYFDDSFVGSFNDVGTYYDMANEQLYMDQDTRWLPFGGETDQLNPPRSDGSTAVAEASRLHMVFLNEQFDTAVLNPWKTTGGTPSHYDQFTKSLGYRLRTTHVAFPSTVQGGQSVNLFMTMQNDGWAAPLNPRTLYLVLTNAQNTFKIALKADWRKWLPGQNVINETVVIPANVPVGDYTVALWMPDNYANLQSRVDYAVRLANTSTWDATTGYNNLATTSVAAANLTTPHRFWKLRILATNGSYNNQWSAGQIELRATKGGSDLTTPSTVVTASSSSPQYGEVPANLVDNNTGTTYSTNYTVNAPHEIVFDLGNPYSVAELAIYPQVYSDTAMVQGRTMKDFDWLAADDAGNGQPGTFTLQHSYRNQSAWTLNQYNVFDVTPTPATAITLTGPQTGPQNAESQVFTLSVNGMLANDVHIPMPDIAGLSFNPSTVTISKATGQATFTVTGTALGSYTITLTNDAGLTNPAPAPFTVVTSVIKHIGTGQEFADLDAFQNWLWTQNMVDGRFIIIGKVHNSMNVAGKTLSAQFSNAQYYCEVTAADDKKPVAPLKWGCCPIRLTGGADNFNVNTGVKLTDMEIDLPNDPASIGKSYFGALATGSANGWGGGSDFTPTFERCIVRCANPNRSWAFGGYGRQTIMRNCLIIQEGPDQALGDTSSGVMFINCGFIRIGTFASQIFNDAQSIYMVSCWGINLGHQLSSNTNNKWWGFKGNVFDMSIDAGQIYDRDENSPVGYTLASNFVVNATEAGDFTPTAAGPLIGTGYARVSKSTNDFFGSNHGLTPDVGPVQRDPAMPLVAAQITDQPAMNGAHFSASGVYTGHADSASAFLYPKDTRYINYTVGPIPVTLHDNGDGTGTFSFEMDSVMPGSYYTPSVMFSNSGGISYSTGGMEFDVQGLAGTAVYTGAALPPANALVFSSGPTSAVSGAPSAQFVYQPNGTFSGTIHITPSDGGKNGTFSPTVGTSVDGGPVAFTYTGTSVGTVPITITNDAGLINPGPVNLTVTSVSLPPPTVAIQTTDVTVIDGYKTAKVQGPVNLQNDPAGILTAFLDPYPSGTPVALPSPVIANGSYTVTTPLNPGQCNIRLVANAHGAQAVAKTGVLTELALTGNAVIPMPQ